MLDETLLWVDLETTGSDVGKDCIIEIGCILTDMALEPIGSFDCAVEPSAEGLGRMMMNDVVRSMHESNGLLAQILGGGLLKQHEATQQLLSWLHDISAPEKLVLAGSGVAHFDRRFIDRYMPQLSSRLRYWCVDVGVLRRTHEMWVGPPTEFNGAKNHRALDDIKIHLREAQHYRDMWREQSLRFKP